MRPAFSNSSALGGWLLDDSYIMFARGKETMLITNSPVSSMLLRVSLAGPSSPTRGPRLMHSIGGCREATVKKLKGARLRMPYWLRVEVQAIGRGTTEPINSLYKLCWSRSDGSMIKAFLSRFLHLALILRFRGFRCRLGESALQLYCFPLWYSDFIVLQRPSLCISPKSPKSSSCPRTTADPLVGIPYVGSSTKERRVEVLPTG